VSTIPSNNNLEIKLPQSSNINTTIGLKHLNNNSSLYLKILNSFKQRYTNINIQTLNPEERERTLHTIKGLTATLGMESLLYTIQELEKRFDETLLPLFSQQLALVLEDIQNI